MEGISNFLEFFTLEGLFKKIFQVDMFGTITDLLSDNLFSPASNFGPILNLINTLFDMIRPVAVMLLFVYFMVSLVDRVASETFTWEQLWRLFCMLLATKLLIDHGLTLIENLYGIGLSLTNSFSGLRAPGSDFAITDQQITELLDQIKSQMGWLPIRFLMEILLWVMLLIPALISWLMKLSVSVIVYSRIIEVYLRAVFMPAAISDVFHGGLQSTGGRYIKSFFAVCLQGPMIIIISIIYSQLSVILTQSYGQSGDFFAFYTILMAIQASAIMLMFKSLSLTKEVLGAG